MPQKTDELELLDRIRLGDKPEAAAAAIGMPRNRLRYFLRDKWPRKKRWEYGVHWSQGRLTEEISHA